MASPKKIAIIIASTRVVRVAPAIAEVVHDSIKKSSSYANVEVSIVDLADFNLPLYNEKIVPAMVPAYGQFEHEHTKKWSAAIAPFDGYIFLAAEYNGGPPGAAKNAIDYLYNEWIGKPILIVGYGIAGGKNSLAALRTSFTIMKLRLPRVGPLLTFVGGGYGADTQAAIGAGALGEESKTVFAANEDIGKGFEELVELINDPEKKGLEVDIQASLAA